MKVDVPSSSVKPDIVCLVCPWYETNACFLSILCNSFVYDFYGCRVCKEKDKQNKH